MATIQKIEKSIEMTDQRGAPIKGRFRNILIWAVLTDDMRDTLYEAPGAMPVHYKQCEQWLANEQRLAAQKCVACEE